MYFRITAQKNRQGRKEIRRGKRNRTGTKLNQWSEDRMKGVILEYRGHIEAG